MRRLVALASSALVLVTGTALALQDGGSDASILDAGAPDVSLLDVAVDAPDDAMPEAGDASLPDASVDAAKDGAAIKDAKSDVCDPNVEPCTVRADTGPDTDAGDNEEPAANGGCSCDSAPAVASTTPIAFLVVAFALLSRRRKK
jgi:MYXO-CTERM domain-containing protein